MSRGRKQISKASDPRYFSDCIVTPSYLVHFVPARNNKHGRPPSCNVNPGELSVDQRKRIRYSVNLLYWCSSRKIGFDSKHKRNFYWRINFITLTLSGQQRHSDKFIRGFMLEPFIRVMRSAYNMKLYVWKAEVQLNGRLHFHITTDVYIHWRTIRDVWNKLQRKHGYLEDYSLEYGSEDPNSIDVRAVRNPSELSGYLAKYLDKSLEQLDEASGMSVSFRIGCKLWDCCNALKIPKLKVESVECIGDSEIQQAARDNGIREITPFLSVTKYNISRYPRLRQHWKNYLLHNKLLQPSVFNHSEPVPEFL